jgi:hypothetical protein
VPSTVVVPESWKQAQTRTRFELNWKTSIAVVTVLTVAALTALYYVASSRGVSSAPPIPPVVATPQPSAAQPAPSEAPETSAVVAPKQESTASPVSAAPLPPEPVGQQPVSKPHTGEIVGTGKKPVKAAKPPLEEQVNPEDVLLGRKPAAKER